MPRHALASELAAKLGTTYTGAAGRHVLDGEMPTPTGTAGRHALDAEVQAIVGGGGVSAPVFDGAASSRGFTATNAVGAITGAKVGDVLVAFCSGNDQTQSITPPSGAGWTQIGDTGGITAARMYVFVTTATAANQSGGTWTWPASHNHMVTIVAYDHAAQPSAAGMVRAGASASTVDAPSRTSVGATALLVTFAFFATNGTTPAWPGSMTVRVPAAAATAAGVVADEALPLAGASGIRTFSAGGVPSAMTAASLVLEAAA